MSFSLKDLRMLRLLSKYTPVQVDQQQKYSVRFADLFQSIGWEWWGNMQIDLNLRYPL